MDYIFVICSSATANYWFFSNSFPVQRNTICRNISKKNSIFKICPKKNFRRIPMSDFCYVCSKLKYIEALGVKITIWNWQKLVLPKKVWYSHSFRLRIGMFLLCQWKIWAILKLIFQSILVKLTKKDQNIWKHLDFPVFFSLQNL